jgi:hypothetical protein
MVGRPQERGGAVIGGRVYIRVLLDQLVDLSQIIGPGGVGDGGYAGSTLQQGIGSHQHERWYQRQAQPYVPHGSGGRFFRGSHRYSSLCTCINKI